MSQNILKTWALLATAMALVLLGVLIGQSLNFSPAPVEPVVRNTGNPAATASTDGGTTATATSGGAESDSVPAAFTIPATFAAMPVEWRTDSAGETYDGYAILFAPSRREVIVDQCRHPGYFDTRSRKPIDPGQAFCNTVLWSRLDSLDEHTASVTARDGQSFDLKLSLTETGKQQRLALSFEGHDMSLVPGSKNDLFQAMEQMPGMVEQKRLQFEYLEAEYQQRRLR